MWPDDGIKSCLISPKIVQKVATHFYIIIILSEIARKLPKYLGYFCETNCCQEPVKIAQSGHTDQPPVLQWPFVYLCRERREAEQRDRDRAEKERQAAEKEHREREREREQRERERREVERREREQRQKQLSAVEAVDHHFQMSMELAKKVNQVKHYSVLPPESMS